MFFKIYFPPHPGISCSQEVFLLDLGMLFKQRTNKKNVSLDFFLPSLIIIQLPHSNLGPFAFWRPLCPSGTEVISLQNAHFDNIAGLGGNCYHVQNTMYMYTKSNLSKFTRALINFCYHCYQRKYGMPGAGSIGAPETIYFPLFQGKFDLT